MDNVGQSVSRLAPGQLANLVHCLLMHLPCPDCSGGLHELAMLVASPRVGIDMTTVVFGPVKLG